MRPTSKKYHRYYQNLEVFALFMAVLSRYWKSWTLRYPKCIRRIKTFLNASKAFRDVLVHQIVNTMTQHDLVSGGPLPSTHTVTLMRLEHLTEAALEKYALDQVEHFAVQTIEEHLIICSVCRERLASVDEEIRILRQTLRFAELDERKQRAIRGERGSLFLIGRPTSS